MELTLELRNHIDQPPIGSFEDLWVDTMLSRAAQEAGSGDLELAVKLLYSAQYCYPYNGIIKQAIGYYISALHKIDVVSDTVPVDIKPRYTKAITAIKSVSYRSALQFAFYAFVVFFMTHYYYTDTAGDFAKTKITYVAELTKTTDAGNAEMIYKDAIDASRRAPLILMKPKQAAGGIEYQVVFGPFAEQSGASDACDSVKGIREGCIVQEFRVMAK